MRNAKVWLAVVILVAGLAGGGLWYWQGQGDLTYPQAVARLDVLLQQVAWSKSQSTRKAALTLDKPPELQDTLPDIRKFALVVDPPSAAGDVAVEIFASVEKAGKGFDGWMVEVANDFNRSNIRLRSGLVARVKLRAIPSGEGYQYIAAQKYLPDAYSPSHLLWMKMLSAQGIPLLPISERLLADVAGIVMKERVWKTLQARYGTVDVRQVLDAVAQGHLAMGYTDPFVSSAGLNFLVTVLASFAQGDSSRMLADDVVSAFETFQRGVPFVALTTPQIRDSVQQDGSLEAFIINRALFAKAPALQSGYAFIPYGVRHDAPLYGIGQLSADKQEALRLFAQFTSQAPAQKLATEYGFNQLPDYQTAFEIPPGEVLIEAQKVWKRKKDAGRPVVAVFVGDVSGSMEGVPLRNLKQALLTGSQFIAPENAIGLVVFSQEVKQLLPIGTFSLNQRALFSAAVQDMRAGGNTAMYDGITVALKMLVTEKARCPECKPLLIVLTDGETNAGLKLETLKPVLAGLKIPIYTVGYNAKIDVLRQISAINEAASLNADEGDIAYKIGALLNAEM
ncbi:MAG: VWA domain-containing protein [Candidatus Tectimicrobiota bacterium]